MSVIMLIFSIIALTFLIIGTVFFLIGFFRSRPIKYYDRTKGVIIKKERHYIINLYKLIHNEPAREYYTPDARPTVVYEVEGEQYTFTSSMSQQPGMKIGKEVNVFYDRYQPNKAIIDTFVQRGTLFTLIGTIFLTLGILFLSVSAFSYFYLDIE